jgi:hypothetical protein
MSTYTRKPIEAVAHCPLRPWIRIYFQTSSSLTFGVLG